MTARGVSSGTPVEVLLFMQVDLNGPVPAARPDLGPCWLWDGCVGDDGYGTFSSRRLASAVHGKNFRAHRLAYEWLRGPIPEGLELDHLCRVRRCCNPWHVEPVTRQVNLLRGATIVADYARKTRCPAGHQYDAHNTYVTKRGIRQCRACNRARALHRYRATKSTVAAG